MRTVSRDSRGPASGGPVRFRRLSVRVPQPGPIARVPFLPIDYARQKGQSYDSQAGRKSDPDAGPAESRAPGQVDPSGAEISQ